MPGMEAWVKRLGIMSLFPVLWCVCPYFASIKHASFHFFKRNVNEIRRRFHGKESSPLEAIRELG